MKELTFEVVNKISSQHGDSFYVLDSDVFEDNYKKLLSSFKEYYDKVNIAYSYKTNYIPKLAMTVNRLGGFAEVVSDMEAEIALKSGVGYERIIWNGPVKNMEKVKEILLHGGTVNVDSELEYEEIRRIADNNLGKIIRIGLRCNYEVGDEVLSRFGIDVQSDDFDRICKSISDSKNIKLICLQAHFAKRNSKYWIARTEGMLKVYKHVKDEYGLVPERIDLGGGIFGPMPESMKKQLGVEDGEYEDYAKNSARIINDYFKGDAAAPTLLIEPGTAVAANSMRYVCKIKNIKRIRGKVIATANGSQKNISVSGINPPMNNVGGGKEREYYTNVDIAGYTCIESDYLYRGYTGELGVGDYLVFGNCGSYSLVMKPPFIFPNVPVIDVSGDEIEIIKRRESFDDIFTTYNF